MKIVPAVILGLVLTVSGLYPQEVPADVRDRAQAVIRLLASIDAAGTEAGNRIRTAVVDEKSVNDFIAYRLSSGDDPLRELVLNFRSRNRLEGRAVLQLKGKKVPAFLQSPLSFLFQGRLESAEGRARIRFDKLYLNGQPLKPALVDLISALAQGVSDGEGTVSGLEDWYELPYGIRDVEIRKGALAIRY